MTPTASELLNVLDDDGDPVLTQVDLQSISATEAAKPLCENWAQSITEGETIADVVVDVDLVVYQLNRWRDKVVKTWGNP